MELGQGSLRAKGLFLFLVAVYLGSLVVNLDDKIARVGQPDVGWQIDDGFLSPTREDASAAGLRGGGRALRINGHECPRREPASNRTAREVKRDIGAQNTITIERADGEIREVTIRVREWRWHDVAFTEGATFVIGLLYFIVGVTAFALRPYEIASWALLVLCSVAGSVLSILLVPFADKSAAPALYFLVLMGFMPATILHAALAFPVVHTALVRFPQSLAAIYTYGGAQAAYLCYSWWIAQTGELTHSRALSSITLLITLLLFEARCLFMAVTAADRVIAQRARILFAGSVLGLGPAIITVFFQQVLGLLAIDNRIVYWPLGVFLLTLARVTLRPELLNARIAVRRAVMYGWAVGVLTLIAILLSAVRPYAVAALLFPLLYFWPRFDARLNRRLYPKRARVPELMRGVGERLAAANSTPEILEALADSPAQIADARRAVALLFRGAFSSTAVGVDSDGQAIANAASLADEPLIQIVRTTRKEVSISDVTVDSQYSNIKAECLACFARLGAELILPIVRGTRVVGILAIGPRTSGDAYEPPELDAISTLVQQAVQSLIRIEATERLRSRELEFAELKRFFPPQVIDQVMARGGASELRTQRKIVTVVFVDLRGFTAFSDSVEPEEVMATLAEYHGAMGRRIAQFAGTLERFAGDGFMVFFNDPVDQPDHVARGVGMALAMRTDVRDLRESWLKKGYSIDIGIGLHTGYATCGFIGYEGRRDYGVIGNTTNLAARLSDAASAGEILISTRVHAELRNGHRAEPIGELQLKGFHQAQIAYRLLDPRDGHIEV